jgi:hypothetical protein
MTQKLKPKHIFALIMVTILFTLIFLNLYVFQWFVPTFKLFIVNAILATSAAIVFFYFAFLKMPESFIMKLGVSGMNGIFTFIAILGFSAGLTFVFGTAHQYKSSVFAYYWSSGRCGYRLKLNDFTPISGGFCNAGQYDNDFKKGDIVDLTVKETILGNLVLEIKPSANSLLKR